MEDKIKEVIELLERFEVDPYPEDVFPPVSNKELKDIHKMLKKEFNMPLDRLSGHIGRILRKPIKEDAIKIKNLLTGKKLISKEDILKCCYEDDSANGGVRYLKLDELEELFKV